MTQKTVYAPYHSFKPSGLRADFCGYFKGAKINKKLGI